MRTTFLTAMLAAAALAGSGAYADEDAQRHDHHADHASHAAHAADDSGQGHEAQSGGDAHAGHEQHGDHQAHDNHQAHGDHNAHANHPAQGNQAAGDDPHAHHRKQAAAAAVPSPANVKLSDATLINRDGRRVQLVSDVLAGKIAVINFVYTTCTTVCPVTSATFAQLQREMGGRLGKDVVLVSITVDPVRDSPARLEQYAQTHDAGEHWLWLTGSKSAVDEVLRGMGAYTPNFQDHPAMVLVGDASNNRWSRFFGFPSVKDLVARVDAIGGQSHDHGAVAQTQE